MGVTCDEYIILRSYGRKPLKKIKKHIKSLFKKETDLKPFSSCVGNIGGGMNGHYSLVILPSGWNGGYSQYQIITKIKDKVQKINVKAERFNKKNKNDIQNHYEKSKCTIYWDILSFTDWGITFESHLELENELDPELKWASNLRKGITPKSGAHDLDEEQYKRLIVLLAKDKKKKNIIEKLKKQYLEQFGKQYQ